MMRQMKLALMKYSEGMTYEFMSTAVDNLSQTLSLSIPGQQYNHWDTLPYNYILLMQGLEVILSRTSSC